MKDEFEKNLSDAQKEEMAAQEAFQALKTAKLAEIAAAQAGVESKTAELADTKEKHAQAKEDLEDTNNALSADQKFLIDLKERCKLSDEEYATRLKSRGEEIIAIGETIKILTNEDARDLFSKSVSFLQIGNDLVHESASRKRLIRARVA